ncbi:MAG: hypothetical protein R3B09_08525 [Nannocystaceae bacterium]
MRRVRARSLLSLALLVIGCSAPPEAKKDEARPSAPASTLPPLDRKVAAELVEALHTVVPEQLATMATQGLAELEGRRLPPFLLEALTAMSSAPPDQRALAVARALDSVPGQMAWIQACRGGLRVFQDLATVAAPQRAAILWKGCNFVDQRLTDEATAMRAEPVLVMLAHLAHDHLRRGGEVSPEELEILAAMMAPASPEDAPKDAPADAPEDPAKAKKPPK